MRNVKELRGFHYTKENILHLKEKTQIQQVPRSKKDKNIDRMIDLFDDMSLDTVNTFCESEIEKQVGFALFLVASMEGEFVKALPPAVYYKLFMGEPQELEKIDLEMARFFAATDLLIVPNLPFLIDGKKYRSDFVLSHKKKGKRKRQFTLLECDSFQYHSTPEQLEREKRRDRAFSQFPQRTLHFSGREIHRNPTQVAYEILETCLGKTYG